MRLGRLQPTTLDSIIKALSAPLDNPTAKDDKPQLPSSLHKQYLPVTSDSPLFKIISIATSISEVSMIPVAPLHTDISIQLTRLSRRATSLPNIVMEAFESHIPSFGRLFQSEINLLEPQVVSPAVLAPSRSELKLLALPELSTINGRDIQKVDGPRHWSQEYRHIDIDWSMQAMDVLYSASFYDYIRDERNVELSAQRLGRVVKDYKPRQVAEALSWMVQGWSVETTAKLLRLVFSDWLADLAGCVFGLISRKWPKDPQTCLCVAFLLMQEPKDTTGLFLKSLMVDWKTHERQDMMTYLEKVLKWKQSFYSDVSGIIGDASVIQGGKNVQVEDGELSELEQASQRLVTII